MKRLVVKGLVKRYRYFELVAEELVFREGVNLIVGPNGSGKSTLLKAIAGFVYPERGEVFLEENGVLKPVREVARRIGYVGEDVILPNRRVRDILVELVGEDRLGEVVSNLGLENYLEKKYMELSSGYRRRVQLAIALGKDPDILILDEPFANLDFLAVRTLKEILRNISGRIVLLTSHIALNIESSTLTVLEQGRVLYHGEPLTNRMVIVAKVGERVYELGLDELNKVLAERGIFIVGVLSVDELLSKLILETKMESKR